MGCLFVCLRPQQLAGVKAGYVVVAQRERGCSCPYVTCSCHSAACCSHSIDEEEYGGPTELMFEGLLGSFASFMVSGRGRGLEGMGGSPCCTQPRQTHNHCGLCRASCWCRFLGS